MIRADQNELAEMLRYKRPAGSASERAFRTRYLAPLNPSYDHYGNGYLMIGDAPIIWSSHTDTVHYSSGMQDVWLSSNEKDHCFATSNGSCLGADCTTGVFIMMQMIRNKVPGLYIFHYGEEKGCLGSRALVKARANSLSRYKACIAFDRKGYNDIVRYQHGRRCCSDVFVDSLAAILDRNYSASSGVYTDSAEYTGVVGECTNISVGYFNQHTSDETQDIDFALWLANRMCEADFSSLTFSRKPGEWQSEYKTGAGSYYTKGVKKPKTMYEIVYNNPAAVANMLLSSGISIDEMEKYCSTYLGVIKSNGVEEDLSAEEDLVV